MDVSHSFVMSVWIGNCVIMWGALWFKGMTHVSGAKVIPSQTRMSFYRGHGRWDKVKGKATKDMEAGHNGMDGNISYQKWKKSAWQRHLSGCSEGGNEI